MNYNDIIIGVIAVLALAYVIKRSFFTSGGCGCGNKNCSSKKHKIDL